MSKIALALYVKNEYSDIAGWISWHLSLGVDTIFIFDDYSVDGTYNVIMAAESKFDIRVFRTSPELYVDHDIRHGKCLEKASKLAAEEGFDWIGFLDADEYLSLSKDENVKEFLNKFDNFDAVAINWCIYGSSGKVVRPRLPIVKTFTSRSTENFPDNVLVKSFIRPDCFGTDYRNPHRYYSVPEEKYSDPSGKVVIWNDATNHNVSWNDAKIMHFVCRSMEHFVTRIKRRLNIDLRDSSSYWDHFNKNDVLDMSYDKFYSKCEVIFSEIEKSCLQYGEKILEKKSYDLKSNYYKREIKEVFSLRTTRNTDIYVRKTDMKLCHMPADKFSVRDYYKILAFSYEGFENYVHIIAYENEILEDFIFAEDDLRVSPVLSYKKIKNNDNDNYYLKSTAQNVFLSSPGHEISDVSLIECNRRSSLDWEEFVFVKEDFHEDINLKFSPIYSKNEKHFDFDDLIKTVKMNHIYQKEIWIVPVIGLLNIGDIEDLKYFCRGLFDIFV